MLGCILRVLGLMPLTYAPCILCMRGGGRTRESKRGQPCRCESTVPTRAHTTVPIDSPVHAHQIGVLRRPRVQGVPNPGYRPRRGWRDDWGLSESESESECGVEQGVVSTRLLLGFGSPDRARRHGREWEPRFASSCTSGRSYVAHMEEEYVPRNVVR